jgi:fluoride exporter
MMKTLFFIFIGGGIGSICRYGLSLLIQPWQLRFPLATLVANGLSCFVLGIVLGYQLLGAMPEQRRLFIATGFCGGFSTFSTFTAETWQLIQQGQTTTAIINIGINLAVCFIALLLGLKIA